jgi:hypothetical protein
MGQEIVYCFKCASRLLGSDFDKGKAFRVAGKSICLACAKEQIHSLPPEEAQALKDVLAEAQAKRSSSVSLPSIKTPIPFPAVQRPQLHEESSRKMKALPPAPKPKSNATAVALGAGILAVLLVVVIAAATSGGKPPPRQPAHVEDPDPPPPPPGPGPRPPDERPRPPRPVDPPRNVDFARELEELDREIAGHAGREEFRPAWEKLNAARARHLDERWRKDVDARFVKLDQEVRRLFTPLLARAVEAKKKNDPPPVAEAVARVAKWNLPSYLAELESALGPAGRPAPGAVEVYTDGLAAGWTNASWDATVDLAASSPAEGRSSIAFAPRKPAAGLFLRTVSESVDGAQFPTLAFSAWSLRTDVVYSLVLVDEALKQIGQPVPLSDLGGFPPLGAWKRYAVPLASLGAPGRKVRGFMLLAFKESAQPSLHLDTIAFTKDAVAPPPPQPPPGELALYQPRWEKALDHALARDYEAAAKEVEEALKGLQDAGVKAQAQADLEALRLAQAVLPEASAALLRLPRGWNAVLGAYAESGAPVVLDEPLLRAEPGRLELRRGTVEAGELRGGTLADLFRARAARKESDARAAALFCLFEGDAEGAARQQAGALPAKYAEAARRAEAARAAPREAEARRLFFAAETEHRTATTRTASTAKFKQLLSGFADTAFVRRNQASIAQRAESGRDYFFSAADLGSSGLFRPERHPEGRLGLTMDDDLADKSKRMEQYVDVDFSAHPDLEYRAWIYAGACCAETFAFSVQASELTGPDPRDAKQTAAFEPGGLLVLPVQPKLGFLRATHAAHGGRKEPTRWDWIPLPMPPKFAAAGPRKIRLFSEQQGFTVAYALVSAVRRAPPRDADFEELKRTRPALHVSSGGAPLAMGRLLREYWTGIGDSKLAPLLGHASFPNRPSGSDFLTTFEGPRDWADNYGSRIRGYLHPPATGPYVFWIAADDDVEVFLSSSEDPGRRTRLLYVEGAVANRAWDARPEQKSAAVALQKGRRYYVEVLHKEGNGGDHVALGWQLPDGTQERPIPGKRISAWTGGGQAALVDVTSPAPGAVHPAPSTIPVAADYFGGGTIVRAEVYDGNTKVGEAKTSPLSFEWKNVPQGAHLLSLRVVERQGAVTSMNPLPVRVGDVSFYRAVNLNGPATTIDGCAWEGRDTGSLAKTGHGCEFPDAELRLPTDPERAAMIRSSIHAKEGVSATLLNVPAGSYLVYVYAWERAEPSSFDLAVEGKVVLANHTAGPNGRWDRLGPFPAEVADGTIEVKAARGAASLSGIEVWRVGGPPPPSKVERTAILGGPGGNAFEDAPADRPFLVGFKGFFGTFENRRIIKAIRPVFEGRDGTRTEGQLQGNASATAFEFPGKPGYAVAGLVLKSSARIDGFKVILMRISGSRLNPADRLESEWIGGPGGDETTLGGDGSPVVGLHGRAGADCDALGLILFK